MNQRKPDPQKLPGKLDQRVFVGGHYDAVPTLRAIAQFVREASSPERKFIPIIPLDYEIAVEETMEFDLKILNNCRYAIFDLTDLGAQLVEMQEARQHAKDIKSLLVYPVRERRNEPERGRRTVLSFALPHFGYLNFAELKTCIWRFLTDIPAAKDPSPRAIYDPDLDKEVRWIRVLCLRGDPGGAVRYARRLLETPRYKDSLDLWLQIAAAECRNRNAPECQAALQRAMEIAKHDGDAEAEVWYFEAFTKILVPPEDWPGAMRCLLEAEQRRPGDGRILQVLGFVFWHLGSRTEALERTRRALEDSTLSDPLVSIHAMNNLGWFLCDQVERGAGGEELKLLDEALEVTRHLRYYDEVFSRRDGTWLDTRGWARYLEARTLAANPERRDDASKAASEAVDRFEQALRMDPDDRGYQQRLSAARELAEKLQAGGKA